MNKGRNRANQKLSTARMNLLAIAVLFLLNACYKSESISIDNLTSDERIEFGIQTFLCEIEHSKHLNIADLNADIKVKIRLNQTLTNEEFTIKRTNDTISIEGGNNTAIIYASETLSDLIQQNSTLPANIEIHEKPKMVMRGTAIGLQKTTYLPDRHVYEYPYTEENFPWFYDKELWVQYLDMMVENRFNSLYLWNGHPFASLVKLKDYPFAVEVSDEQFQQNVEMFDFITHEANKRGIWVIQMFYNIIVSKPFAEHYGIKTQDRGREITPVIADYTYQSIKQFVIQYPNVGLMVCLGEAMNTIDDDVEWFTKTIIPAVKDGIAELGLDEEPPIVLRGHDTDAAKVMEAALPIYQNLYTTYKYNGESLTTYNPCNQWAEIPTALSKLGSIHISNVHILANLEPLRYGSPDFISKSIEAMHTQQGANGLHLYPQASYWDWPYTADKTEERLLQVDRDDLWYKAWGRYAWDNHRPQQEDKYYWTAYFQSKYDCNKKAAESILNAYNEFGEISPKLDRKFAISDGNRQSLLLGMFMSQFVNPNKWTVYQSFVESNGPEGERLEEYVQKEINGQAHVGETPIQIISEVIEHANKALKAIQQAAKSVSNEKEEFARLQNDIQCYYQLAYFFNTKVKAAEKVLQYKYTGNINFLEEALPYLKESVEHYKKLVDLTKDTYLYANSMQTSMRRVPIAGTDGKYKHWAELLPKFEEELVNFTDNIEKLKNQTDETLNQHAKLKPVKVEILNNNAESYTLKEGSKVNIDKDYYIEKIASELSGLKALRYKESQQRSEGTELKFKCNQAVKVVVGYFNTNSLTILQPPSLETNAHANDRGQADIRIANAMIINGLYPVHVYTYQFEEGINELKLNKGRVLILGFIDGNQEINTYDAGITIEEFGLPVDWLFY